MKAGELTWNCDDDLIANSMGIITTSKTGSMNVSAFSLTPGVNCTLSIKCQLTGGIKLCDIPQCANSTTKTVEANGKLLASVNSDGWDVSASFTATEFTGAPSKVGLLPNGSPRTLIDISSAPSLGSCSNGVWTWAYDALPRVMLGPTSCVTFSQTWKSCSAVYPQPLTLEQWSANKVISPYVITGAQSPSNLMTEARMCTTTTTPISIPSKAEPSNPVFTTVQIPVAAKGEFMANVVVKGKGVKLYTIKSDAKLMSMKCLVSYRVMGLKTTITGLSYVSTGSTTLTFTVSGVQKLVSIVPGINDMSIVSDSTLSEITVTSGSFSCTSNVTVIDGESMPKSLTGPMFGWTVDNSIGSIFPKFDSSIIGSISLGAAIATSSLTLILIIVIIIFLCWQCSRHKQIINLMIPKQKLT